MYNGSNIDNMVIIKSVFYNKCMCIVCMYVCPFMYEEASWNLYEIVLIDLFIFFTILSIRLYRHWDYVEIIMFFLVSFYNSCYEFSSLINSLQFSNFYHVFEYFEYFCILNI